METDDKNKIDEQKHTDMFWLRVDAVAKLILGNQNYLISKRRMQLVEQVKKHLGVETRWADEYIKEAKKLVRKIGTEDLADAKHKAIRDREALLLMDDLSAKEKLEILKDRDDLKGLYTSKIDQKVTFDLKDFDLPKLTDEQLDIVEGMIKRKEDPRLYLTSLGLYRG